MVSLRSKNMILLGYENWTIVLYSLKAANKCYTISKFINVIEPLKNIHLLSMWSFLLIGPVLL